MSSQTIICYHMIKELIIRDFFSFKGEHKIELNSGVNILVGVNGSGKTSFLNAFTLLHEGIAGNGLSALFRQWGTYNAIINACGEQKPDCFSITYVFDADVLKRIVPASPYYKVFKVGEVYLDFSVFSFHSRFLCIWYDECGAIGEE